MSLENNNIEYKNLTDEELEIVSKVFYDVPKDQFIRLGPKGYYLPKNYLNYATGITNMELRPDDVFVTSYQRSGTTLTQELVWLIANNMDYEQAAKSTLAQRFPFLEYAAYNDDTRIKRAYEIAGNNERTRSIIQKLTIPVTDILSVSPSPRFVKTHLPMSLLPPKLLDTVKVVYVARDPRDTVVSSYYHARLFKLMGLKGTCKDVWNAFLNDLYLCTPYFEHVKEAWALRNHPNMLFLFYEDITQKMPETLRRVAAFFGKELTQEQIDSLCDHLKVENFKKNESVNFEQQREYGFLNDEETFIRKGKSGGWREYFDEEMQEQVQKWIADNLRDTDLRFPTIPDL